MSRLQLVDLRFFNDQSKTLLSSLDQFNRSHGKALAVIYQSYVQLPLTEKTDPEAIKLMKKI